MAPEISQAKDQQHPQYRRDRQLLNQLSAGDPTDLNLAELARLKIRYTGFPGAWDIQADLDKLQQQWGLTEATLFAKTRQIHQAQNVYRGRGSGREDWS